MKENHKKIVIAQILPNLQGGGVERGTIELAYELKKQKYLPLVISNGGKLVRQLEAAKITHVKLPVHSKNPFIIFLNIFLLICTIKKHRISLIHVRSRAPMISTFFACKLTKTRLVSTVHGAYSTNLIFKNSCLKKFYNGFMLRADRVIAVSNFIKQGLINDFAKKFSTKKLHNIKVIARGVDLKYFNAKKVSKEKKDDLRASWGLTKKQKLIFFPARFTAWKGHDFLLDALAKVKSDNYLCVMAGASLGHEQYKKEIKKKAQELGLGQKVKIVGNCEDMAAAYALADLVVSASLRPEAFGRISIEAQAMGRVMVATNIGGSLETITNGKTGFLVVPHDVLALKKVIEKILTAKGSEIKEIKEAAMKNAKENFSNEKMFAETIKIYANLLNSCATPQK